MSFLSCLVLDVFDLLDFGDLINLYDCICFGGLLDVYGFCMCVGLLMLASCFAFPRF